MATSDDLPPTTKGALQQLKALGESSLPPTLMATLTTALHLRPFQPLPMLFPPVYLFTSYLSLQGFSIDAAGLGAAWSATYLLVASRRKPATGFRGKFTARGAVRGATMGLAAVHVVAGGLAYGFGRRDREDGLRARKERGIGESK